MMEIGDRLKQLRLLQGKTQKEMSDGCLDRSFYSRVENNKNSIVVEDLISILRSNNISIVDFFNSFGETQPKNHIYQEMIETAFVEKNINKLQAIQRDATFTNQIIKYVAELLIVKLENRTNEYEKLREKFKKYIYHLDKWDEDSLWILAYIMFVYDFGDLEWVVDSIFNKFQHDRINDSKIVYLLAQISVDYLKICSKQDKAKAQVQKTLDFLDDLPNISEIALYKMYGICCQSTNHKKDYENILKESGYERYFK